MSIEFGPYRWRTASIRSAGRLLLQVNYQHVILPNNIWRYAISCGSNTSIMAMAQKISLHGSLDRQFECGGGQSRDQRFRYSFAKADNLLGHGHEDFHVARIHQFDGEEIGLFAVFDGHKGPEIAEYPQDFLYDAILAHPKFSSNIQAAIREPYLAIDQRIVELGSNSPRWRSGSTGTTSILMNNAQDLVVANVGDSRAVLLSSGKVKELFVDHDPDKPQEREMVESKGGEVNLTLHGIYRVNNRLAMSRSFGDYSLKEHLTVEPDIWQGKLTAEDKMFVIATDGLWHQISSNEAIKLLKDEPDAKTAINILVKPAMEKNGTDDITVIVIYRD